MKLIGITGGIGAGKSVVSRILRLQGYEVYDCDLEARRLMEDKEEIREAVCSRFGENCLHDDGSFDRQYIASRIFSFEEERSWLNTLIHSAVREDLLLWCRDREYVFVESAILNSSGLTEMCDEIWVVTAPKDLRISRALSRGGISRENLISRMEAQSGEFVFETGSPLSYIDNSGQASLLDQIKERLKH